jgi:hypothetical protein
MVLPLGPHGGPQQVVRLTKTEEGLKREDLILVRFVPMVPGKAQELSQSVILGVTALVFRSGLRTRFS